MIRTAVAAAVLAASLNTAAQAQDLWRGSRVGMSVDQVRQAVPEAFPNTGQRMDNADPLLRVTGFRLADADFKADFYFNAAGLQTVALRPVTRPTGAAALLAAEDLIPDLSAKYGEPYNCNIRARSRVLTSSSCQWMSGSTRIMVFGGMSIGGDLEILYEDATINRSGNNSDNL